MKKTYDKPGMILACAAIICVFACPIVGLELLSTSVKFLHYVGAFLAIPCPFVGFILFIITVMHGALRR